MKTLVAAMATIITCVTKFRRAPRPGIHPRAPLIGASRVILKLISVFAAEFHFRDVAIS